MRYYTDDGILLEVQWWSNGRHCRRASASLAADNFPLFGKGSPGDPAWLSSHKISSWDTVLCELGLDIHSVAMIISVPGAKREQLREMLIEWPSDREVASEDELRSLIGQLLHLCEVVRPGK